MSSRTYSLNAFETTLTAGISASSTEMIVNSAAGLTAPCYLVIDPDKASEGTHEFVKVTDINTNTLTIALIDRDLPGSGDGGTGTPGDHILGAVVRAVPVHQWLDDLFTDIEASESDISNHIGAADPHTGYLLESDAASTYLALAGGVMSGAIQLPAGDPAGALIASHKGYVDAQDVITLASAASYSDSLDHDHATAIATHAGDADAHHDELHGGATHLSGSTPDGYVLTADGAAGSEWRVVPSGVTDHGALTGLGDDDHTQYHTNARGDALYYRKSEVYTKGQVDALLAALTIPASRVTAGVFASGSVYTFSGGLTVAGTLGVGAGFELPNIAQNAGTHALRYNSSNGVVTYN